MTDKERLDLKQRLDKQLEGYEIQAKAVKSKGGEKYDIQEKIIQEPNF